MQRLVLSLVFAALGGVLLAGPAVAGPAESATALAVPRTAPPPITFGYSGQRPPAAATASGICRPSTPAPAVDTGAFGCATRALRGRPVLRVKPSPAPFVRCAEYVTTNDCSTCSDCSTCPTPCTTCPPPCSPCPPCTAAPPTQRIDRDPLSIPTAYWSSGYNDGGGRCPPRVETRDPCRPACDPCTTTCTPCPPVCEPCPPRRVVYRRVNACDPCAPRTVYRRAYAPRYRYAAPCGPVYRGCGPRYYGGCGPYRSPCRPACGPCYPGAAAAVGFGLGLALPLLACACL